MQEDYKTEELLELIGEEPQKKEAPSLDTDSKIKDFINRYNLNIGLDRIPTYVVYYMYKVKYRGELSKIEFFRQFKKEGFIQVRTGRQRSYLLDCNDLIITREDRLEAEYYEKKEKNKKKSRKISRSKRKDKS